MRVLITAGPTREPIDPIRYIGNRSSGQMGLALARSAIRSGHLVTLILGPATVATPTGIRHIDVETTRQLHDAVLAEFPKHDLLIMAAAVADYRPTQIQPNKIDRVGRMTIELEATEDILTAAGHIKRPDQRTIGFSLVERADLGRSREKLLRKSLDLIVHNPLDTMNSKQIEAVLLWPDGRSEKLPLQDKEAFADILLARAISLFT